MTRALRDRGLELTPAAEKLNAFNAVQNTYLDTFQVLGALGLLLGSVGLGVVVLRNVLERRGELALLAAGWLLPAPVAPPGGGRARRFAGARPGHRPAGRLAGRPAVLAFALGQRIMAAVGGDARIGVGQRAVLDVGRGASGLAR